MNNELITLIEKLNSIDNYEKKIKQILQNENLDINYKNKNGSTAIMIFCFLHDKMSKISENIFENIFKLLINHPRIDLNIQNKYGYTALIYLCYYFYNNNSNLIKILLNNSKNLNLNIKDKGDQTALMKLFENIFINKNEKLELFQLFLKYKYCKLDIIENKLYKLIDDEYYIKKKDYFEYKELLYYYKCPSEYMFLNFQTEEYYNCSFNYLFK